MSATNSTPNYELPVFLATDKPAWLTDWNGAMQAIDTAIHDAQSTADGAQTTAGTATADIATINASLSTITSNITSLTTTVNGNTGSINTINSLIGNGQPTTEDKTIIGAINEIYAMIGGGSTVTADVVTYDNTTSGLTATNVQSAIDELASAPAVTVDADDVTYDNTASGLTASNVQSAIDEVVTMIPSVPSVPDMSVIDITLPATLTTNAWTEIANLPSGYTHSNCAIAGIMYYATGQDRFIGNSGDLPISHSISDTDKIEILSSNVPAWIASSTARVVLVKKQS